MEEHLGYATRDAFDFFKDGEQGGLDAALRLKRNDFSLFLSSQRENTGPIRTLAFFFSRQGFKSGDRHIAGRFVVISFIKSYES